MPEAPRSNRPQPRTGAAIEAELRRRVRTELLEAREQAEGELDDASLAGIIARAIASALSWHLEAPEHTRNATLSSRTWRSAGGPRGGGPRSGDFGEGPPARRGFEPREPRDFERGERDFDRDRRGPRDYDRPQRDYDRPQRDYDRPARDYDRPTRDYDRGPRDEGGGFRTPRGGGFKPKRGGGGFSKGPRRPPRGR